MNPPLPINLIFSIQPMDIESVKYKTLIEYYKNLRPDGFDGFYNVFAQVNVSENTKKLLPDVIDFLYDNDIHPIVQEVKTTDLLFADASRCRNLYYLFSDKLVSVAPYSIFVNSKTKITPTISDVHSFVQTAIQLLHNNPELVSVGFVPHVCNFQKHPVNTYCDAANNFYLDNNPVFRTRDLWLTAYLTLSSFNNMASSGKLDEALSNVLRNFGPNPHKFMYFNPSAAILTTV